MMEHNNYTQPGLEPVPQQEMMSAPKPENMAYGHNYGDPQYNNTPATQYSSPAGYGGVLPEGYSSTTQPVNNGRSGSGRKICGLAAVTFLLIVAIVVLIIAAAVGGGVGGTLAVNNAKTACLSGAAVSMSSLSAALASATSKVQSISTSTSSSASPSATTTSATQPWGPVGTDVGHTQCPVPDGSTYTSKFGPATYSIYCNKDQPSNDLLNTIVTTFDLCMETCSSWNSSPGVKTACAGVAYVPSFIDGDGGGNPVNCYLKSVLNETALATNTYVVDIGILNS